MLVVRQEQLDVLTAPVQSRFEAETLAHLGRYYPTDMELLGEAGLLAVIRAGQREAMALGFTLAGEVRQFITLCMVLGSGFLRDPLLPWAARILEEAPGEPGTVERLAEEAAAYLELISGEEGQYALRAMLRAVALGFDEVTAGAGDEDADTVTLTLLRQVWPQKFRLLPPERRAGFLRAAAAKAAADGLDTPGTARLYTLLMFLLGAGFASDPAIPWAGAALAAAPEAPAPRARALYDAGLAAVERLRAVLPAAEA